MRPRLLDLFSGAGGCAAGYALAGFDVTGVDVVEQPRYPFTFHKADAMTFPLDGFDAIHASPPCQAHSTIAKQQRTRRPDTYDHPDLVDATRARLKAAGVPYVIENVPGAPLPNAVQLCGSSFGLDVQRHRLFECSFPILALPCAHYWQTPRFRSLDRRTSRLATVVGVHGHHNYSGERDLREKAMGIDWMSPYELTQAIPPAYTEYIGGYLMADLRAAAVAA
jgi:DNA (cytosine-5)-methyltransferase 1